MFHLTALIPLLVWTLRPTDSADTAGLGALAVFAGFAVLLAASAVAHRHAATQIDRLQRPARWSRLVAGNATLGLLAWFAYATFSLGWPAAVAHVLPLSPGNPGFFEILLGTGPAYLAWAGLVAAEWPVIRRQHEQTWLFHLDTGHDNAKPPPTPLAWWTRQLRMRLGVALAPVLVFWISRDLLHVATAAAGSGGTIGFDALLTMAAMGVTLAFAPLLLIRMLPTRPMAAEYADLQRLAEQAGVSRKSLRIWEAGDGVANALAVGILPRLRFVLMSDTLLMSLPPEGRAAVLLHELGHIRHRHVAWFVLYFAAMFALAAGPGDSVWQRIAPDHKAELLAYVSTAAAVVVLVVGFVFLSRLFERQADAFAGRLTQRQITGDDAVGPEGATIFVHSLEAAMRLNGTPSYTRPRPAKLGMLPAWLWQQRGGLLHGGTATRARNLAALAVDPSRTAAFDRRVVLVKTFIAIILLSSGLWIAL